MARARAEASVDRTKPILIMRGETARFHDVSDGNPAYAAAVGLLGCSVLVLQRGDKVSVTHADPTTNYQDLLDVEREFLDGEPTSVRLYQNNNSMIQGDDPVPRIIRDNKCPLEEVPQRGLHSPALNVTIKIGREKKEHELGLSSQGFLPQYTTETGRNNEDPETFRFNFGGGQTVECNICPQFTLRSALAAVRVHINDTKDRLSLSPVVGYDSEKGWTELEKLVPDAHSFSIAHKSAKEKYRNWLVAPKGEKQQQIQKILDGTNVEDEEQAQGLIDTKLKNQSQAFRLFDNHYYKKMPAQDRLPPTKVVSMAWLKVEDLASKMQKNKDSVKALRRQINQNKEPNVDQQLFDDLKSVWKGIASHSKELKGPKKQLFITIEGEMQSLGIAEQKKSRGGAAAART